MNPGEIGKYNTPTNLHTFTFTISVSVCLWLYDLFLWESISHPFCASLISNAGLLQFQKELTNPFAVTTPIVIKVLLRHFGHFD